MSHDQKTWEVRNQVSGTTQGTPKMTWLAKYSESVSWKVLVAGATYTSLILLLFCTIHLPVQSTVYSYSRTSVLCLLRKLTYLYWYTYRCTLYFYGRTRYEYCVQCTCTTVRVHVLILLVLIYDSCIGNFTVPTQPRYTVISIDVRHYDYYLCTRRQY